MQWSSLMFLSLKTLLSGNVFQWQGSVLGPVGAMFWRQSNLFSSPFLPSTAGITSQGHPLATENAAEMGKRVQHPMVMLGIQMQPRSPRTEKTERNLETNPANNLPHRQETHMNPGDPWSWCPSVFPPLVWDGLLCGGRVPGQALGNDSQWNIPPELALPGGGRWKLKIKALE